MHGGVASGQIEGLCPPPRPDLTRDFTPRPSECGAARTLHGLRASTSKHTKARARVSECAAPAINVVLEVLVRWQYNNDAPIMTLFDTTSIRFYIQCHLFNSAITLPLLWLPPRRALNFATRRTSAELMHTHTPR
jgi:hypothetical protein